LGHPNVRCVSIPEPENGSGARFSAGFKLRFGWQAIRESTRWKPDLIICSHVGLGPIGWLLANVGKHPYWIVVYGIEGWAELPGWKKEPLRRADRVIAISDFSWQQVVNRHAVDESRISKLPCALDEALLSSEPLAAGSCERVSPGHRVVLTVARMAAAEGYKGHDVVLGALPEVLARVPNLLYVIVGDGDDRPRFELLAEELGLSQNVIFTGEVKDFELAALYRRSEVFVLPARTVIDKYHPRGEGFGIVYLEAMAFGKPVIGPDCGAPAEIIRHGQHGLLVDPESPAAVAEALLKLLTCPDLAQRMGQAGEEWVRRHYSYDCFRERLRVLLDAGATTGHEV
jgi:glycosyltransferase involved in cell wall biosynthesis